VPASYPRSSTECHHCPLDPPPSLLPPLKPESGDEDEEEDEEELDDEKSERKGDTDVAESAED